MSNEPKWTVKSKIYPLADTGDTISEFYVCKEGVTVLIVNESDEENVYEVVEYINRLESEVELLKEERNQALNLAGKYHKSNVKLVEDLAELKKNSMTLTEFNAMLKNSTMGDFSYKEDWLVEELKHYKRKIQEDLT